MAAQRVDGLDLQWRLTTPAHRLAAGDWADILADRGSLIPGPTGVRLPVAGAMVGLPSGAQIQITVSNLIWESLPLSQPLPVVDQGTESLLPTFQPPMGQIDPVRMIQSGMAAGLPFAQLQITPIRYDPAQGQLLILRQADIGLDFLLAASQPSLSALGPEKSRTTGEDALQRATLDAFLNRGQATAWASQAVSGRRSAVETVAYNPPARSPGSYKLQMGEPGLYQITRSWLERTGIAPDGLNPDHLQIWWRGDPTPVERVGLDDGSFDPGDSLRFYAAQPFSPWRDQEIYWLSTRPLTETVAMSQRSVAPTAGVWPGSARWPQVERFEENRIYDSKYPIGNTRSGADHWFWADLKALDLTSTPPVNFKFEVTDLGRPNDGHPARLRVAFQAYSNPEHHIAVSLNGVALGSAGWRFATPYLAEFVLPPDLLRVGDNTVTLSRSSQGTVHAVMLNWFEIETPQPYTAQQNRLAFPGQSGQTYHLTGFSSQDILLYDVSDPAHPDRLIDAAHEFSGGHRLFLPLLRQGFTPPLPLKNVASRLFLPVLMGKGPLATYSGSGQLVFTDQPAAPTQKRSYLALTPEEIREPLRAELDQPSDWGGFQGAQYWIISHASFLAELQPLLDLRRGQGLSVAVTDVAELYDEFGGGMLDPEALRLAISQAYHNWSTPPTYVLLVGDGVFDFRNYNLYNTPNFIPPYLDYIDPWLGEVAVDNRYAAVDGEDAIPDLALGRIPAQSPTQAATVIAKIVAYENEALTQPWPTWKNRIVYAADNTFDAENRWDGAGDFALEADQVMEDQPLPAGFANQRFYYDPSPNNPGDQAWRYADSGQLRTDLHATLNDGALLASYTGHSSQWQWAVENLLNTDQLPTLYSQNRPAVIFEMTCLTSFFHMADQQSLDEQWLLLPERGAVATVGPSGFGVITGHGQLHRGINQAIFGDRLPTLGQALILGKIQLAATGANPDLLDTYLILGDPALGWHLPPVTD